MTPPFADRRCPLCGHTLDTRFVYREPPVGEVRFSRATGAPYNREIASCSVCGHFVSLHAIDLTSLYAGDYVNATYGPGDNPLKTAFDRVNGLDPARSDNVGRVRAIEEFATKMFGARPGRTVLDVGSGLCVFGWRMREAGWLATAIDPDARAARHASEVAGVRGICGDFMTLEAPGRFDLVAFNKVLEHVIDPVAMLARARACVSENGFVYVEVPDGEAAAEDGQEREEFFIDHWHMFSAASLSLLARRAGFQLIRLERLREPSTKFTLRAFLEAAPA